MNMIPTDVGRDRNINEESLRILSRVFIGRVCYKAWFGLLMVVDEVLGVSPATVEASRQPLGNSLLHG
jgi:hypothetical protein